MDSSSKEDLGRVYEQIMEWRRNQPKLIATIPWTESHLSKVSFYISRLSSIRSDFKLLSSAKVPFSDKVIEPFIQELQKFFIVPKLRQLYVEDNPKALKKNELLAAFISFLIELLHQKIDVVHSFEDRIEHLKKELRFLVTVLGDTLFLGDELEQVKNLLAEFEQVANEAGSLVYSFIFAVDGVFLATRMDDDLNALFDHIHLLKDNIIKCSNLVDDHTAPKTVALCSLFVVDSLLSDLEDLMNRRLVDMEDQINELHRELMLSKSWLDDIKLPLCTEIEEAMTRITDVGYEAAYLVNSFSVGDAPLWYLNVRLPKVIHKIKLIGTELQEIKKNYDNIGVSKVAEDLNAQLSLQGKMHSPVDEVTIGLEDKTIHVLDQLVAGTQQLQIITISGMPGLGKTTLAKKLYDHQTVNYYFDRRSWCVVSQTYQRRSLLIDIMIGLASERDKVEISDMKEEDLAGLASELDEVEISDTEEEDLAGLASELDKVEISDMEEEDLAERIYKSLKGRRYLIVMDDVWDSNPWDDFRRYFPDDGNGSRILFTSRNKHAAPPNSVIYDVPPLSNDRCWELLQKKVFRDKPCPPQLQRIGKEIAENCQGLPLAVVVVAGILLTMDKEESAWKNVGGSLASHIFSDKNNSMIHILKLSYIHLPEYLRPCFLYFGAFPEDAEIPVKKLKCLWIAEGFIRKEEKLKTMESVAEEYLMELIDRSLVMVTNRRSDGGAKACVVHDLLRDLCLRIAEEENFLKLTESNYFIYSGYYCLHVQAGSLLPFGFHIRSLFVSRLELLLKSFNMKLLIFNMKLLKVLSMPRNDLSPDDESEHLVYLRYLAINRLPSSVGNFVNLEFLIVTGAIEKIVYISSLIQKLVKLKYLSVQRAYFDRNCNSYKTNNLEYLSSVRIGKVEDEEMLKCSPHLRKLKCKFARLIPCLNFSFLTQLESLHLTTLAGKGEISFPLNIRKLSLCCSLLPCEIMSIIGGLSKLEVLKLENGFFTEERWDTRDGEFQQLRFLKLTTINIAEWNVASNEHFPRLQRLVLWHCSKLKEIPSEIGEIVTLQLIEVKSGQESLVESAVRIQQEQQEMGNEELNVIIKK